MPIKLKGVKTAKKNFGIGLQAAGDGAFDALPDIGETIEAEANREAPKDTGALIASSDVSTPEKNKTGGSISIGYKVEYAAIQHESPDQPKRKWLQKAIQKYRARVPGLYNKEINKSMRKARNKIRRVK